MRMTFAWPRAEPVHEAHYPCLFRRKHVRQM